VTGDFDVRVQVTEFPISTAAAKAGIMLRKTMNANSAQFGSYINPPAGSHLYNPIIRLTDGVNSTATPATDYGNTLPQWLRLKRAGNVVKTYYSNNGINWTNMTTTTLAAEWTGVSPNYVGLAGTSRANTGVARISYRNFGATPAPALSVTKDGSGNVVLSWPVGNGTLLQSTVVTGPYTTAPSQANPQTIAPSGTMFYRLLQ
jgi:hypothetical protein